MAEKVNLQKKIQEYRQTNPKLKNLSDENILSIMVQNGVITLSEEQKRSVFANNKIQNSNIGLQVEKSAPKSNLEKTIYLQLGRKVVYTKTANGKLALKYYGTDGTQLNPDYFKKVEGQISISTDGTSYTLTKNGKKSEPIKVKDPTQGAIDQNLARLNNEEKRLNKTKNEQGFIGSSWNWIKNKTGIGDGSDKAQKQIEAERNLLNQVKTGKISKKDFKEVTGLDYSKENLEKFKRGELSQATAKIDGYKEGQEMASDVAGDMISGIAAVGIYTAAVAAAPFTGGASIAVGIAAATASGALIKAGVKALDTVGTDRKYTLKDFGHDAATGAFSGALAPITGGLGGAVGKTVATKLGIQAVKQVGKEVAEEVVEQGVKQGVKQGLKTALTNPIGYEYVGGTLVKRGTVLAAEMATDGALGGAIDGGFRAGLDNDWDADAIIDGTIEGGVGGALMAPIIGGGFKAAGKGGQKLGEKISSSINSDLKQLKNICGKNFYMIEEYVTDSPERLKLALNLSKQDVDEKQIKYILKTTNRLQKTFPKINNVLVGLTDGGMSNNTIEKFISKLQFIFSFRKIDIDESTINSLLSLQKNGADEDMLFSFLKLKIQHSSDSSLNILKNYTKSYTDENSVTKRIDKDFVNEIYILLKDLELREQIVSKDELKNIFENYNFPNVEYKSMLAFDELAPQRQFELDYLIKHDKNMFKNFANLISSTQMENDETLPKYFLRINKLRKKNDLNREQERILAIKSKVQDGYTDSNPIDKIDLTPEEKAEYEKNPTFWIRKAGDVTTKIGSYKPSSYNIRDNYDKLTSIGLQVYPRYNSTKYLKGKKSDFKYEPLYRFLSPNNMNIVDFIDTKFPKINESCQFGTLQCCSPNPYAASGESMFNDCSFPVRMIIHPKGEISKAHFIGGNGEEVRYGANAKFKVIDKYIEIKENDAYIKDVIVPIVNHDRYVTGIVVLQEI